MTRTERRLLIQSMLIGTTLTMVVVVISHYGGLATLELWLYDGRFKWCHLFTEQPTDRLVHIDIDDPALDTVGKWPWDRSTQAHILDEIRLAGAKVIGGDIIYSEPQKTRYVKLPENRYVAIDDDEELAQVLRSIDRILLPLILDVGEPAIQRDRKLTAILTENLDAGMDEAYQQLQDAGLKIPPPEDQKDIYVRARRHAMFDRLDRELDELEVTPDQSMPTVEQMYKRLFGPSHSSYDIGTPIRRLLEHQYRKVQSIHLLRQFAQILPEELPPLIEARYVLPPIPHLARSVSSTGFVTSLPDDDGVVRSIPLAIYHRGWVFIQFGLALACAHLDVPISAVRFEAERIIIPTRDNRQIVVPVYTNVSKKEKNRSGMIMDLPWFGKNNWEYMYDYPNHKESRQHIPIVSVWALSKHRTQLRSNISNAHDAIGAIYNLIDQAKLEKIEAARIAEDDFNAWQKVIDETLEDVAASGYMEVYKEIDQADLEKEELVFLRSVEALKAIAELNPRILEQLEQGQARLQMAVKDRTVLIGWTASSIAADFVPTSLHHKCPGPVVHGVVFNGIVTNNLLTRPPDWIALLVTVVIGLITTAVVSILSPQRSLIVTLMLGAGYLVVNGVLLFDYSNLIVGAAGPTVAVTLVWGGCTLARFIVERAERARITKRFRSYVDPVLVNYVIEHPEQDTLDGQIRELTVVFTDLASFTTLSERLREQTVPFLQEYMGLMVPIIRRNHGYVNKFLGDGIMFFYGAPLGDELHPVHAVQTSLQMQEAMVEFNQELNKRNLPNVAMRVGISTGPMVVGDAGPADASDYTVLGDSVNLGARLESANKATGTHILMTERTAKMLDGRFLLRPVAKLQVVGKEASELTYEAVAFGDKASAEQRQLAELTSKVVDTFVAGDFQSCQKQIDRLEKAFAPDKLTTMYRKQCQHYVDNPPANGFDGSIMLSEK